MSSDLTDRERMLTLIIAELYSGHVGFGSFGAKFGRGGFTGKDKLKAGDLVLALTATGIRPSQWSVSEIVEPLDPAEGGFLVRDIVTGETCRYGNEAFVAIEGIDRTTSLWLAGARRRFAEKVQRAFALGGEYTYREGPTRFTSDTEAMVSVRCVFGGMGSDKEAVPFEVPVTFTDTTTPEEILEVLRAGGYGTREFEYRPRQAVKS